MSFCAFFPFDFCLKLYNPQLIHSEINSNCDDCVVFKFSNKHRKAEIRAACSADSKYDGCAIQSSRIKIVGEKENYARSRTPLEHSSRVCAGPGAFSFVSLNFRPSCNTVCTQQRCLLSASWPHTSIGAEHFVERSENTRRCLAWIFRGKKLKRKAHTRAAVTNVVRATATSHRRTTQLAGIIGWCVGMLYKIFRSHWLMCESGCRWQSYVQTDCYFSCGSGDLVE